MADTPSPPEERLGLVALDEVRHQAVRNGCVRASQRLRRAGRRTIGLLPASSEVSVIPIGIQLAVSLAAMATTRVGIVDANPRAPLFPGGLRSRHDEEDYATRWITSEVALLVPFRPRDDSAGIAELRRTVRAALDSFGYLFVDLTGLQKYGDHLAAVKVLEGVIVVAVAGVTAERDLMVLERDLPAAQHLGVLLVGGEDE